MTHQTLVDVLRERARDRSKDRAFTFLTDGEAEGDTLEAGEKVPEKSLVHAAMIEELTNDLREEYAWPD